MDGLRGYDEWKTTEPSENFWENAPAYRCPTCKLRISGEDAAIQDGRCWKCGSEAIEKIECGYCGKHITRGGYCSRACARADEL